MHNKQNRKNAKLSYKRKQIGRTLPLKIFFKWNQYLPKHIASYV